MAMATGGRERTGADIAVAVTGIAGPDGGTDAKPVGLTYVAVADAVGLAVRRYVWAGDRSANKRQSAAAALELLIERVEAAPVRTRPAKDDLGRGTDGRGPRAGPCRSPDPCR